MRPDSSLGVRVTEAGVETLAAVDSTFDNTYWYDLRARQPAAAFVKRMLDVVGALAVLSAAAPLMLVVVLLRRDAVVVRRSIGFRGTEFARYTFRGRFASLPQLFNVLEGTMSLVGPRPLAVEECEDTHRRRFSVKPGLTGLWRVCDGDASKLDREYVNRWSVRLDLEILARTLFR
jgi:lipopolysaccharide/colanic/teichoic acid biosynthesis glycosyltransferase